MKSLTYIISILVLSLFFSCSKTINSVYWVKGEKVNCTSGAGNTTCLSVFKGEDLSDAKWENFYSTIQGFNFEKGYLKKIEVSVKERDKNNIPADASSKTYTLVKELEKKADYFTSVSGNWILAKLNNNPINRMVVLPQMMINTSDMRISGNNGCNNYSGGITLITENKLILGQLMSTKKACLSKNIETEFMHALSKSETFKIETNTLSFFDNNGNEILTFIKS
jgi:heat shock protein HslJ